MLSSVLTDLKEAPALAELRPEPLARGVEPEERTVYCGISWKRYLAFDKALGDDRPGPRLYVLDGELELVTTSNEHERVKEWVGDLEGDYLFESRSEAFLHGQATMRVTLRQAGAEPDKSWCIGEEKKFPDIVLEIALTRGGVSKLEVYRRFEVPEVWLWRRDKLEIYSLEKSGTYKSVRRSRLLPDLDIALIERCVRIPSWRQARQTFRAGLAKSK